MKLPLGALFLALAGAVLPAQDEPPPAPDPELDARLERLREAVRDGKTEADQQAIEILGTVARDAGKGMHPKDLRKAVTATGRVFLWGRRRPPDRPRLYHAAAATLAKMGEVGAQVLHRTFENERRFPDDEDWVGLRAGLVRAMGRTRAPGIVGFLLETARRSRHDRLMAAAGEALGHFAGLPVRRRVKIVEGLVRRYGAVESKAGEIVVNRPGEPQQLDVENARATLSAIRSPWNATLGKLTGQDHEDAAAWQEWLNGKGRDTDNWKPR